MKHVNQTSGTFFILLGLSNIPYLQAIYFFLFLMMYVVTLFGNTLLIAVVRMDNQLQTPMYFFLSNLSFVDICFSSTIVPKILINTLAEDRSISFFGCALQMFFHLAFCATECIIVSVMAYDRYAAICKPLHYNTIMNNWFCTYLVAGSWTVSSLTSLIHAIFTFKMPYCRSFNINHFFCKMPPVLKLSCSDTWFNDVAKYVSTLFIGICSFSMILISYVHIISTIMKIQSSKGRKKAFSTCTSHLTVVSLTYGTIMLMYLHPRSSLFDEMDKILSIIYSTVTPMLNPIIYSIRNQDVTGFISKKLSQLTRANEELQKLLKESGEANKTIQDQLVEIEAAKCQIGKDLGVKISTLEKEIENANDLLSASKCKGVLLSEEELIAMSPTAAAVAKVVKPDMKLTELYNAYMESQDQLLLEKLENKRTNKYLDEIVKEVEAKAPILKRQREEYERMQKTIASLSANLEQAMREMHQL
ncbi:olfactory receptor 5G3-like [Discoglossus pictus]